MSDKNQLFSNMYQAALDWLKDRSPEEISRKTGASFENGAFRLESLGIPIAISYPDYHIVPKLEQWHILTLLHYLYSADGTFLSGRQITFADYRDGMVRGGGFDHDVEKAISQKLGLLTQKELEKRCLALGAKLQPSNADICAEFMFAPNYPVWLKVWFADEEFPASGRMLLDASAEHYLSIEDAVTVGSLILDKLLTEDGKKNTTCQEL